ncbi:MAG: WD40 repeat domain-containing protein [Planctomycetes bacterium]|nr:WD40 repeat domain-containing protein [Planctomycetota bacterium]
MRAAISLFAVVACAGGLAAADPIVPNAGRHTSSGFLARASDDGKTVVTLGSEFCVRVWDVATGTQVRELWVNPLLNITEQWNVMWLAPDGKTLALRYHTKDEPRGRLALVPLDGPNVGTYRVVGGHPFDVDHVCFSPDGKRIATACKCPPVVVWDVATGKRVCEIQHDADLRASGLAFTPDGKKLTASLPVANVGEDKRSTIATHDAATGKRLSAFEHGNGTPIDYGRPMWAPDGETLALHRDVLTLREPDGALRRTIGTTHTVPGKVTYPVAADFDAKGRLLVAWHESGEWLVRDEIANKDLARIKRPDPLREPRISFTASGHALVRGSERLAVYDLNAKAPVAREFRVAVPPVAGLGWATGPTLAWGSDARSNTTANVDPLGAALDFDTLRSVPVPAKGVTRRVFEWDGAKIYNEGSRALTVTNGKSVVLDFKAGYDWEGIESATLLGPGYSVASTSDGLITFDSKTGQRLTAHKSDGSAVLSASPGARFFAAAKGYDPLIRVYDPKRAEPVLTVFAAGEEWVAWTPAGAWASSPAAGKWAGTLTKPAAGKLPTFVPFDPKLRDPDKVKAALK